MDVAIRSISCSFENRHPVTLPTCLHDEFKEVHRCHLRHWLRRRRHRACHDAGLRSEMYTHGSQLGPQRTRTVYRRAHVRAIYQYTKRGHRFRHADLAATNGVAIKNQRSPKDRPYRHLLARHHVSPVSLLPFDTFR